ncbi:cation:proton antiporter, partial [Nocardia zapadnayensis]
MNATTLAMIQLGAVFFGLGVLGRIAARIGMSPIPLYLVGGLVFGEGGFFGLHEADEFIHLASEIGVVLLLLLLGLEYSAAELFTGMRRSWMAGLLDLVLNTTPGVVVA